MKYIKGFLGFIMILFGSMLIAITIDDVLIKNILLRIIGAFFVFIGIDILHRQFHPDQYKKNKVAISISNSISFSNIVNAEENTNYSTPEKQLLI